MAQTLPKAKLADIQADRPASIVGVSDSQNQLRRSRSDPTKPTEVYGDWPEIDAPCEKSPVGQCQFSWRDLDHCMHCGRVVE